MWVKVFMVVGGLAGCTGVALGALTAHAFRHRLEAAALATLETAAAYFLIHGLLLVIVAAWSRMLPEAVALRVAGVLIVIGIFLFCGSLSLAAISGVRAFTSVAPAGGTALMAAWITLAVFGLAKL